MQCHRFGIQPLGAATQSPEIALTSLVQIDLDTLMNQVLQLACFLAQELPKSLR